MMTEKKEPKLLELLSEPLPKEAEQHTKKAETRKGYDTDGYGYQYCVDRFNDILGEAWGFDWEIMKEVDGQYKNGTPFYDITAKVSIWINNKDNKRSAVGGHIAVLYADAVKGAITNAFKKTGAFWGVGRQAYQGMLDDDNKPLPEEEANGNQKKPYNPKASPPPSNDGKKFDPISPELITKIKAACMYAGDGDTEKAAAYYHLYADIIKDGKIDRTAPEVEKLSLKWAGNIWGKIKKMYEQKGWDIEVALHDFGGDSNAE